MKTTRIKNLVISGLSTRTNNENEKNEETAKIATLWDDYVEKNIYSKTLNKTRDDYLYGVYSNYESDVNGDYDVTIGVELKKKYKDHIFIEDEKYLVFKKEGEFPEVVKELWAEIWAYFENEPKYERAYTVDFEKYVEKTEIEIYISIK